MDKKVITFGEIMLRLATPDYLRFYNWQNEKYKFSKRKV